MDRGHYQRAHQLTVGDRELDLVADYRSDDDITGDVFDALWSSPLLRPLDLDQVEMETTDQIVRLEGLTPTEHARLTIETIAYRVRGVLGVRNGLQSIEGLAALSEPPDELASEQPPLRGNNE